MRYVCALALVGAAAILNAADGKPSYSAESVVNSAAGVAGLLAPNTLATVYGSDLSWGEPREVRPGDLVGGELPIMFVGSGVQVLVGGVPAHLLYVSDKQVNFLVPSILAPGPVDLVVTRDAQHGPVVRVGIEPAGPGLFLAGDPPLAIAVRLDGSLATPDNPLRPGDIAILFATGLGATNPRAEYGKVATRAAPLQRMDDFEITFDGARIERANILYAGLAPGFAGLYQVNLVIPFWVAVNPEVRVSVAGIPSPAAVRIPVIGATVAP